MLREFENGQAVVVDSDGSVLRQLVKFRKGSRPDKVVFAVPGLALTYSTKKAALDSCRSMGFPLACVTDSWSLAGRFYFIKYDPRFDYAVACWDV